MANTFLISLRSTRLHLGSDGLANRILTSTVNVDEKATLGDAITTIRYISLPNHVLERFWLEDFKNYTSPSPNLIENGVKSTALHTIHRLLSAAATSFGAPKHSLVHVGKVREHALRGDGESDVVEDALSLVGLAESRECGENAAWFNLGGEPQIARVGVWTSCGTREMTTERRPTRKTFGIDHRQQRELCASLPVELTVEPSEGIIWALDDARVTEVLPEEGEPTPKLIVVSSSR